MAQLKSTSVTGNLAVTNNVNLNNNLLVGNNADITNNITAAKLIKRNGAHNQLLLADGDVLPQLTLTSTAEDTTHVADGDILINKPFITSLSIDSTNNKLNVKRHSMAELGINIIYSFKGTKKWEELIALTTAAVGDVYNISDTDGNGHADGHDWVCHKAFSTQPAAKDIKKYWTDLGKYIDLSGFLPRKGGDMYGTIHRTFLSNNDTAMLTAKASNYEVTILSVYNPSSSTGHSYSYNLKYKGTNSAPYSYLFIQCDNGTGATTADGWYLNDKGQFGVSGTPLESYNLTINGTTIATDDIIIGSTGATWTSAIRSSKNGLIETKGDIEAGGNLKIGQFDTNGIGTANGNIRAAGNVTIDKSFMGSGRISSWWNGRDNALLQQTATSASTYRPIMSIKTTNGSWDIGHRRESEWDNILQFNYTSDAIYDKKTDQTFHGLQLNANGNITIGGTTYAFNSAAQFTYNTTDKCIDVIFT